VAVAWEKVADLQSMCNRLIVPLHLLLLTLLAVKSGLLCISRTKCLLIGAATSRRRILVQHLMHFQNTQLNISPSENTYDFPKKRKENTSLNL
jgi:hypothetical protein